MKKWIIFLSVSCVLLIAVLIFQAEHLHTIIKSIVDIKALGFPDLADDVISRQIPTIVKTSISLFFLLVLLLANLFLLITIVMRKITPLSISENLAAWKEHRADKKAERKQRKLEKAQAKVEQLQDELEKGD